MATEKLSEEANKNELWESNGHVSRIYYADERTKGLLYIIF